jgi:long-chain acyl-CoA synthetase
VQNAVLEAHPTVLIAVPRVLEKAYASARARIEGDSRVRKALVLDAIRTLNERANRRYRGERVPPHLSIRSAFLDRLVASRFRAAAGGRLRLVVSGGASLNREITKVMFVVGFNVVEGYGMTEASPVIACNPIEEIRIGTVGRPLPGVEVRIGQSEEILVRGPNVMKGYLNRPEETTEALDGDGWLHTGDQGALDEEGYLSITGRLKDLIVTSYGKNVSPRPIEDRMAKSRYISQVMVYGDNRKHLVALIVPDEAALVAHAGSKEIPFSSYRELVRREEIRELIGGEIEVANADAPSFERVRGFELLAEPFTLENGMLTPTLKPRRGRISMIHESLIESIYAAIGPGGA